MSNWKNKLLPSEAQFMQDIVEQVPEMARGLYVGILEKLAEDASKKVPTFRYVVAGDGDVLGTNDVERARQYATDELRYVIDTETCLWLVGPDENEDTRITEAK